MAGQTLTDAAAGIIWLRLASAEASLGSNLPLLHQSLLQSYPQTVVAAVAPELKAGLTVWGHTPSAMAMMERIKSRFDPHHLLNPDRYLFSGAQLPLAIAGEQPKTVEVEAS